MAIKDRIVQIVYSLKDKFSGAVGNITTSLGKVDSAAEKSGGSVGKFSKKLGAVEGTLTRVNRAFGLAKAAIVGFAGVLTGRIIGGIAGLTDSWKQLSAQIKLVTANEQEAIDVREQLLAISQRTRTELDANVSLYANLARATKQLGLSQEDVLGITETVSQSLQISGASASESAGALRQLGQAFASGVLRGDEFNSIMENAPRLSRALADSLGVTTGELRAMAEQGELTADKLAAALQGQAGKISEEFKVLPKTFSQVFTTIKNDILAFVGQTDEAGGASQQAVQKISEAWDSLKNRISANKGAILAALKATGDGISAFGSVARAAFNGVTIVARTLVAALFSLGFAWKRIMQTITFGDLSKRFKQEGDALASVVNKIASDIGLDFSDILNAFDPAAESVKKATDKIVAQKDKLDQKLKPQQYTSGYEHVADDIGNVGDSADQASQKVEKLRQAANDGPVEVKVQPIPVDSAIGAAQQALDSAELRVEITPYINAGTLRGQIQAAVDAAVSRAADKAGSK